MEKKMQIEKVVPGGYIVRLWGTLDETLDEKAFADLDATTIIFDLEKLRRVTSFGVGRWLSSIKSLRAQYYAFWGCRPALIAQFNMVESFGLNGHLLSFYAPYVCLECERELEMFVSVLEQYQQITNNQLPSVHCPNCNKEATFDDIPNIYFSYITKKPAPQLTPVAKQLLQSIYVPANTSATTPKNPTPLPNSVMVRRTLITTTNPSAASFRQTKFSLLLLDAEEVQSQKISLLLSSLGTVNVVSDIKKINPQQDKHDLILVNYDALVDQERELLATSFTGPEARKRLVLFSGNPNRADLAQFLAKFGLTNFLARNNEVDPEELYITIHKLISQDIFGVEKYFSWGARSMSKSFRSSQEKKELLEFAGTFAKEAGLQSRFADMFTMVTEELSTNALYDAPTDKEGKHRYAHYSRSQDVTLEQEEEIMATFCCDGRRIGVSVSDPFGSLTPDKILQYLAKCFQKGENQVDKKQGGAGLGLYYTYESVSHLIVNAKPGKQTEVIGLLDLRGSYKDFVSKGKSLNIFVVK